MAFYFIFPILLHNVSEVSADLSASGNPAGEGQPGIEMHPLLHEEMPSRSQLPWRDGDGGMWLLPGLRQGEE